MQITKRRLFFLFGIPGLVGMGFGAGFLLRSEPAHAQAPAFMVTGKLDAPGTKNAALTRLEDKETGVVCYLNEAAGFFSCVKK